MDAQRILFTPEGDLRDFAAAIAPIADGALQRINANPEDVERGLTRLVLALIELIRQLMERQALRRVESGALSDAEIERLGETLMRLEAKMSELKQTFGLTDEDLNLNLGPLGNLLQ